MPYDPESVVLSPSPPACTSKRMYLKDQAWVIIWAVCGIYTSSMRVSMSCHVTKRLKVRKKKEGSETVELSGEGGVTPTMQRALRQQIKSSTSKGRGRGRGRGKSRGRGKGEGRGRGKGRGRGRGRKKEQEKKRATVQKKPSSKAVRGSGKESTTAGKDKRAGDERPSKSDEEDKEADETEMRMESGGNDTDNAEAVEEVEEKKEKGKRKRKDLKDFEKTYGCPRCKFSKNGCDTCRRPGYKARGARKSKIPMKSMKSPKKGK